MGTLCSCHDDLPPLVSTRMIVYGDTTRTYELVQGGREYLKYEKNGKTVLDWLCLSCGCAGPCDHIPSSALVVNL